VFNRATGLIGRRERDRKVELTRRGFVVPMVDSFGTRNQGEMCSQRGFNRELYLKRPRDACATLFLMQAQPFAQADRVGVLGWSQKWGCGSICNRHPEHWAACSVAASLPVNAMRALQWRCNRVGPPFVSPRAAGTAAPA
jgi:hypothetical protein